LTASALALANQPSRFTLVEDPDVEEEVYLVVSGCGGRQAEHGMFRGLNEGLPHSLTELLTVLDELRVRPLALAQLLWSVGDETLARLGRILSELAGGALCSPSPRPSPWEGEGGDGRAGPLPGRERVAMDAPALSPAQGEGDERPYHCPLAAGMRRQIDEVAEAPVEPLVLRPRPRRFDAAGRRLARVHTVHRPEQGVLRPVLRLTGKWLEEAGFRRGRRFSVEVRDRELVIRAR
jgi:hypothetical protein